MKCILLKNLKVKRSNLQLIVQTTVGFCYSSFFNEVLQWVSSDFKMDTKIKISQNQKHKRKMVESAPRVRFELNEIRILLRSIMRQSFLVGYICI